MSIGNLDFELADRRAEEERAAGVHSIQAALAVPGRLICDCGQQISEARRKAMPSARDCIDCATRAENIRKRCA